MSTRTPTTIPPDLQAIIDCLAEQEKREPVAVLADAVEQYRRGKLADLGRYGQARAREIGTRPSDVAGAIADDRQRGR